MQETLETIGRVAPGQPIHSLTVYPGTGEAQVIMSGSLDQGTAARILVALGADPAGLVLSEPYGLHGQRRLEGPATGVWRRLSIVVVDLAAPVDPTAVS